MSGQAAQKLAMRGTKISVEKKRRQKHPQRDPVVAACEACEAAVNRIQQRTYLIQKRVAGGGELDGAGLPFEQPYSQGVLQLLHLVTDRRRGQEQFIGRNLEAAVVGSHAEGAQIAQMRRSGQPHQHWPRSGHADMAGEGAISVPSPAVAGCCPRPGIATAWPAYLT